MLKSFIKRLYHFFLYAFTFVILTFAIVITIIRLALPEINSYRQQTADWLSAHMNYPVAISSIDAHWNSWHPQLQLHQVSIIDPASNDYILNLDSVLIRINVFRSLIRNEITPESITVSDLKLTLIRRHDGSITVSKHLPEDITDNQIGNDVLTKWFFAQNNILIKGAQITLFDLNDDETPLLLSNATLRMRNNNHRIQIDGTALLPTTYGNIINFALDTTEDILTPDWSGDLYIEGQNINSAPFLEKIKNFEFEAHEGTGDVKIWSTWNQAKLRKIEGRVNLNELKLTDNRSEVYINKLSGNFAATRRTDKGIELALDIEELITPNGMWPRSSISLKKIYINEHNKYRYIASASYLNLDDLDYFRKIIPDLPDEFLALNNFEVTGNLHNSVIKYNPDLEPHEQLYMEYDFSALGGEFYDHSLKIEGLSGHIQGTRREGTIQISSDVTELDLKNLFNHPLTFYELNTELNWQTLNNNLIISTQLIDTHSPDFNLQLTGRLKFNQEDKLPFVDVLVNLSNGEIDKVIDYLPANTSENATNWLKKSLVSGEMPSAKFVFRGQPEDYPFKNAEGIFQGSAEISNSILDYHPNWPPLDEMNAEVVVNGDAIKINASSGFFFDAEISKTTAVIENLAAKDFGRSIVIKSNINGKIKDVLLFIKNSPLQSNASLMNLSSQNISGDMGLDLNLNIPLSRGLTKVDGTIALRDALIEYNDIDIELANLNGTIDFTRDTISAKGIKADYYNYPVDLSIESSHGSPVKSTLSGNANKEFISAQLLRHFPSLEPLKPEIEKRITGSCFWEASIINVEPNSNNGSGKILIVSSTLEGLSIDLPIPLAKSTDPGPFQLTINFQEKNRRKTNFQYANILNGLIDVDMINGEKSVTTSLSFGNEAIHNNRNGQLSIIGHIDNLIVSEWLDLFSNNLNKDKLRGNDDAISIDIQVGSLEFINQEFTSLNLRLNNINSGYHLNINAEDINGDIYLDHFFNEYPVNVNLQNLTLVKNEPEDEEGKEKHEINPGKIPPLNIEISALNYNDIDFGQLNLVTSKIDNGLSVDKININKTDMTINGTGIWDISNNEHHSRFNLTVNAASMKTMLETFNYDVSAIKEGKTNLSLDAQWQGTPVDFSLGNLNGTLDMEINKGRLTDLNPTAGRLFGLLSLQTLPRRLSLDFSDLFGKGLAFDNIAGHFSIENGNAYTDNMIMTGPSVNINISGRTGLQEQDYDQIATITPKMSGSLPVASSLFGPIGVGVGAVIFLTSEIFQSLPDKIDTLLRKQYTITGAWDDPQITKIDPRGKDKDKS